MKYKNVLMVGDKEKIKKILSRDRFVPAKTLPKVFIGMIDGDLVFVDYEKLVEATNEVIKQSKEIIKWN